MQMTSSHVVPLWTSVHAAHPDAMTFVVIRCYDAPTWQRIQSARRTKVDTTGKASPRKTHKRGRAGAQKGEEEPVRTRRSPLGGSPDLSFSSLGLFDDNLEDVKPSEETTGGGFEIAASTFGRPTRTDDLLDIVVMSSSTRPHDGARAHPRQEETPLPLAELCVWRTVEEDVTVGTLVPRGMSVETYCALLDTCVRRSGRMDASQDDDARLLVRVMADPSAPHTRRVELSLQSMVSTSAVTLLAHTVRASTEASFAIHALPELLEHMAASLHAYESLRLVAASQARDIDGLRQSVEALTAQSVRREQIEPLEAMTLIVNEKKARIADLLQSVEALKKELSALRSSHGAVADMPLGEHGLARRGTAHTRTTASAQVRSASRLSSASPVPARTPVPQRTTARSSSDQTEDTPSASPTDDDDHDDANERGREPIDQASLAKRATHGAARDENMQEQRGREGPRTASKGANGNEQNNWLNDLFTL